MRVKVFRKKRGFDVEKFEKIIKQLEDFDNIEVEISNIPLEFFKDKKFKIGKVIGYPAHFYLEYKMGNIVFKSEVFSLEEVLEEIIHDNLKEVFSKGDKNE